jgi:hypothetical protein
MRKGSMERMERQHITLEETEAQNRSWDEDLGILLFLISLSSWEPVMGMLGRAAPGITPAS